MMYDVLRSCNGWGMPGFVKPNCELTVGEIAALTHAKLRDGDPADRRIDNIAPLDAAGPRDVTFLDKPKYLDALANTRAGACLIVPRFTASAPRGVALPAGERWAGTPAEPATDWKRGVALLRRLVRRSNGSDETE